ncbi:cupin domain-containing protein [Sinorhizobium numidicum]|uniref:Cupin domain-containing protein n=1 Tax=Sinorhizobium numidicum TaxID=680248 RepID=A0ABY8CTH8_9HYPH|nr:cupin domain-containing protein [Sinorhizobium numidicum]WEX78553.1 cupin domain-containing protein [Sinorhizobium numidicum]WEX81950.1 cupin domain-containing protein [Sinorhizobium numidicum]
MTEVSKPIVNLKDLKLDHWREGSFFESSDASFGTLLGLKGLGIGYGEVPPGKSGCPFHNHHVEEELFVILEGEGTYRFGSERYPVGPGDVLGAPAGGPETAHHLINTGTVPLKYLSISTMAATEICEYPDSGKFLAKTRQSGEARASFRFIGRAPSTTDYWDGEPGV